MKFVRFLLISVVVSLAVACVRVPVYPYSFVASGTDGAKFPSKFRQGRACSVFGLFDNSVAKAAKNAGIEKVASATMANYFGIVTCNYVQGN